MGYQNIASCYDVFTGNIDYDRFAAYLVSLFARYGQQPRLVLDLACGTGNLTQRFSDLGYDMTGVDISRDMLGVAYEKSKRANSDILYLCQDMTELELYGTVDAVVCALDGINCITDRKKMLQCFSLVRNYLNPGGLFIFDVNTRYKLEEILADQTFVYESEEAFCVWENDYHPQSRLCDFVLTFFTKNEQGSYDRSWDLIRERGYSVRQLSDYLAQAGLDLLDVLDEFSFSPPQKESQRLFFVAQKH